MSKPRNVIPSDVMRNHLLPFLSRHPHIGLATLAGTSREYKEISEEYKKTEQYKQYCLEKIQSYLNENQKDRINTLLAPVRKCTKKVENLFKLVTEYSKVSKLYYGEHSPKIDFATLELLVKDPLSTSIDKLYEHMLEGLDPMMFNPHQPFFLLLYIMAKRYNEEALCHICLRINTTDQVKHRLAILAAKRNQFNYFLYFFKFADKSTQDLIKQDLEEAAKSKEIPTLFMQKYQNFLFSHPQSFEEFLQSQLQALASKKTQQNKNILQQSDELLADSQECIVALQDIATQPRNDTLLKQEKKFRSPLFCGQETTPDDYTEDSKKINHYRNTYRTLFSLATFGFLVAASIAALLSTAMVTWPIGVLLIGSLTVMSVAMISKGKTNWNRKRQLTDYVDNHSKYQTYLFETAVIHTVAFFHRYPSDNKALKDLLSICPYLHKKNQLTRQMIDALDAYVKKLGDKNQKDDQDNYITNREKYRKDAIHHECTVMRPKPPTQPKQEEKEEKAEKESKRRPQREPSPAPPAQPTENTSVSSLSLLSSSDAPPAVSTAPSKKSYGL